MIKFEGYISGEAEKRLHKRNRILGMKLVFMTLIMFLPAALMLIGREQTWILGMYGILLVLIPLSAYIPQTKKFNRSITTKSVVIDPDEECIICRSDKNEEIRNIEDVKTVTDRGEYYEIDFPFGKVSVNFICQKNLLAQGTLEEFEALFGDKLKRI